MKKEYIVPELSVISFVPDASVANTAPTGNWGIEASAFDNPYKESD